MSGGFTAIDLAQLPIPDVIEVIDFETILAEMKADLISRDASLADTLALESEPVVKLLEVCAFRETVLRQRVNEAAKANMLAYATGADLDNLAALLGVTRLPGESDDRLRARTQLSLEGFSTAGPRRAYRYHALSASKQVKDAAADSPEPGLVQVTILAANGDGTPDAALIASVEAALSDDEVRPLCDQVTVAAAQIVAYSIDARLIIGRGPDAEVVRQAADAAVAEYAAEHHRLGAEVTLSGLYAALHQPGVRRVDLYSPATNIICTGQQAPWCSAITITTEVSDE